MSAWGSLILFLSHAYNDLQWVGWVNSKHNTEIETEPMSHEGWFPVIFQIYNRSKNCHLKYVKKYPKHSVNSITTCIIIQRFLKINQSSRRYKKYLIRNFSENLRCCVNKMPSLPIPIRFAKVTRHNSLMIPFFTPNSHLRRSLISTDFRYMCKQNMILSKISLVASIQEIPYIAIIEVQFFVVLKFSPTLSYELSEPFVAAFGIRVFYLYAESLFSIEDFLRPLGCCGKWLFNRSFDFAHF